MKIAFYVNETKSAARAAVGRLVSRAVASGLDVVPCPDSAAEASRLLLVALGGDGTILRCVHEHPGFPVLGFNLGGLGYLSAVEKKDFDSALSLLAAGRFRIAERTMLTVVKHTDDGDSEVPSPRVSKLPPALNDIVITREMTGHAARLDLSVDGRRPTRYLADGLVIATPTGSTAYSLSAGGPVVMSDARSFVITPMNPHALGIRPQVVADSARLIVASVGRNAGDAEVLPRREKAFSKSASGTLGVYADGVSVALLAPGESVEIFKSEQVAKFVELEGYDPYAVLAHKLGWTGTTL